ncbi:MAG: 23S rRNA (uracil(1939)-C(5))-methyltransferase RlmD [Candidatus Omnitrophota bacterium]
MSANTLEIDALSTQGEGIGRIEGKTVFVPYTLPGEQWEIQITESRKNYDRAAPIRRIGVRIHPRRAEPRCPYYGKCGGCQLQHIEYEEQLRLKRDWLQETFRRIGHIEIDPAPVAASQPWEYRNKINVPLRRPDKEIQYAFHQAQAPAQFVTIEDCYIAHPKIRQALAPVLAILNQVPLELKIPRRGEENGSQLVFRIMGEQMSLQLLETKASRTAGETLAEELSTELEELAEFIIAAIGTGRRRRFLRKEEGKETAASVESFLQVNDAAREQLYRHVLNLPFAGSETALDGYCGAGLLTRRLTERFASVTGVEADASSAADAVRGKKLNQGGGRIRIEHETMEHFLEKSKASFQTVILNPPRMGLSPQVRQQAPELGALDIVMISCHPAALARDAAAIMKKGYRIESLHPFDMFPQTYHLEAVLHLKKNA